MLRKQWTVRSEEPCFAGLQDGKLNLPLSDEHVSFGLLFLKLLF